MEGRIGEKGEETVGGRWRRVERGGEREIERGREGVTVNGFLKKGISILDIVYPTGVCVCVCVYARARARRLLSGVCSKTFPFSLWHECRRIQKPKQS